MERALYEELPCKSVLNRVKGMSFGWSINPYRGCQHACVYCYARITHEYLGLGSGHEFQTRIQVKVNAPEVLRHELSRPSWKRERVAIGTATDPYQPAEGRFRLTRRILEALRDYRTPASIVTKSTLVLRDLDVLQRLSREAGCSVFFSITTLDKGRWRKIEPGTPPPQKRLEVMQRLVEGGVTAGVMLAPILPGLTDDPDNLEAVIRSAVEHKACSLGANVLRLAPGVKDWFTDFLHREYPSLTPTYLRMYPRTYAPEWYVTRVKERVTVLKERLGMPQSPSAPRPAPQPVQLPLGL